MCCEYVSVRSIWLPVRSIWLYVDSYHATRTRFLEWIYTLYLPEWQRTTCSKQARYLKFKWLQWDLNPQPLSSWTCMVRTYSQMQRTDRYSQNSSISWSVWLNGWVFVYRLRGCGFESCYSHLNFDIAPISSMEFLDIQGLQTVD